MDYNILWCCFSCQLNDTKKEGFCQAFQLVRILLPYSELFSQPLFSSFWVKFGTSFRITIFRKPFETDQFGVVDPSKGEKSQSDSGDTTDVQSATQNANGNENDLQSAMQSANSVDNIADRMRELIRQNSKTTRKQMSEALGISERSVQRILNKMSDVRFTGGGEKGHWVIDGK